MYVVMPVSEGFRPQTKGYDMNSTIEYTLSEVIKVVKAHRGAICVDARLFADDMCWVECKKGDLLWNLKAALTEGTEGSYSFRVDGGVGYFSADS